MGKLFGTSGVRGVVGKRITPELAIDIGLTLAAHLGNSGTVVLGKGPRTSSDMLESCMISGLLSGGCELKLLDVVPTPTVGFATRALGAKAGVMITASHNPPEYNGFKIWDSSGMAYTPESEGRLERIYFKRRWKRVAWDEIGRVERIHILSDYIETLKANVRLSRDYKVVVDCGNGAGSVATPRLLSELGCKVIKLNCLPDGHFPGRPLEPVPENLVELCETVKSTGADLGIAHDGDADRVVVVDEAGRVAKGDEILAIVAAQRVRRGGDIVVTTVDASKVVDEVVGGRGGRVVRTRVGDVSVAVGVKRNRAVFGGEPSGAWIFPDVHLAPDGPLGAVRVLELLESSGRTMSELLEPLPDYYTHREKLKCQDELKARVMKSVLKGLKGEFRELIGTLSVDGVRLNLVDGWVLVRPSGTEPYIRVTAEARTPGRAHEIAKKAVRVLKSTISGG